MVEMGRNIESKYIISANFLYIKFIILIFNSFRKSYKNYLIVFLKFLKTEYPITGILKNNRSIRLKNSNALLTISSITSNKGINYDIEKNFVEIFKPAINSDNRIKIFGGIENGDMENVFIKEDYKGLPIKNKTVIDIGANIGDSSLYFAINGATKVLAFEPFQNNYDLAKKNVFENNMSSTIEIIHAGIGSKDATIKIENNRDGNVDSIVKQTENGEKTSIYTLETIIKKFTIPEDSILKIDCEGCEYDVILSSSMDTLQRFGWIVIEYHNGYENIVKKLEESNFKTSISKPMSTGFTGKLLDRIKNNSNIFKISKTKSHEFGYVGLILAQRLN